MRGESLKKIMVDLFLRDAPNFPKIFFLYFPKGLTNRPFDVSALFCK
jgi:hypothetical protein